MVRGWRGFGPPILTLLDLLEQHRGAIRYDWRTRLNGASADMIGDAMPWGEAWDIVQILAQDPTSMLSTSLSGADYPVDRTALVLMDIYDLQMDIVWARGGKKGSRPKRYPRPWPDATKRTTQPNAEVTQEQIVAALRFAGHTAELPAA